MVQSSRLVQVFNVQCVLCGRAAGQIVRGRFIQSANGRAPVPGRQGSRCGECGGNLYLEPDESITPFMAEQIAERQAATRTSTLRAA